MLDFLRYMRRFSETVLVIVGLCILVPVASAAISEVKAVRLGIHENKTRFVLEIDQKPEFRIFYLANPNRIVIDLQEVSWKTAKTGNRSRGIIDNYRYGLFRQGTSRIVLDVKKPVKILRQVILSPSEGKPYRFFIDVAQTDQSSFLKSVKESRKQQLASLPTIIQDIPVPTTNKKWTVVVDAGHGGIDPGAIGRSGVHEKSLTLKVAKKLRDLLRSNPRYRVVMTRDNDTFLSLRERVNVGRKYKGDLFISLHADSIGRADISGSTVYTLSENASDDEADELAKSHNKSDIIAGVDLEEQDDTVQDILIDLAQRETMNFSVKFAKLLIPEITSSGMKTGSRSHRFAGFRVLKAPDVPSVLVELGYLSNRHDEKLLKSTMGQKKLASSIYHAINKYFDSLQP
ncbi:hypothetical protein A9Q83_08790 [Alphaproteobacteria bacterium 46_93_T64]|nr:hypothetical protein A9Q83_08790 [Alphaproteobacteria bacterium 46_93_T64]